MDHQVTDRRADTRVGFATASVQATLRPGCSVRVVDLSPGGALVEGERPLRPGARVHVHVVISTTPFTATARVLRCAVWKVHPTDGVTYRGALQFENRCDPVWEAATRPGANVPVLTMPDAIRKGQGIPAADRAPTRNPRGSSV